MATDSITVDEGQVRLHNLAEVRKSKSQTGRALLKHIEQGREGLVRAREEALKQIVTTIERVDEQGQVHTEVIPGIGNGGHSAADCLITTNARSMRPRINALTTAIHQIDKVIRALKYGQGEPPSDPADYLHKLWESIPPAGEQEVISAPAAGV
jgi:hypothetical protein